MTEYCKHGLDMAMTCRKCGRIKKVEVPDFAAKKVGFTSSIGRLEETVRQMNAELAKPVYSPPPARAQQAAPEPVPADEDDDTPPPPPPPIERFPWQRR
jgi:hypothetical protein